MDISGPYTTYVYIGNVRIKFSFNVKYKSTIYKKLINTEKTKSFNTIPFIVHLYTMWFLMYIIQPGPNKTEKYEH